MRFLHTSITVRNMEESIAFYTGVLGLEFERRRPIPENHAEIAFVMDPLSGARVELTHWDGKDTFDAGEQLDHLAFEVEDMEKFLTEARMKGAKVAKEPYTLAGGSSRIAFILDPNDVWIEIIEHRTPPR
jgi:lactoylglutathione lyase